MILGMILNVFQVASSYPEGSPFSQGRRKSQLTRAKVFEAVGYTPRGICKIIGKELRIGQFVTDRRC
jgi:hypothetical protein